MLSGRSFRVWFARCAVMTAVGLVALPGLTATAQIAFPDNPVILNSDAYEDYYDAPGPIYYTDDDQEPVVATDRNGVWISAWHLLGGVPGNIHYARSLDDGATWSDVAELGLAEANDYSPDLVVGANGTWVVMYEALYSKYDLYSNRTTDAGQTWSDPVHVTQRHNLGLNKEPRLATDGAGTWITVYQTTDGFEIYDPDYDIAYSVSTDDGVTWTVSAPLNEGWDMESDDDTFPSIATDGKGTWVVAWDSEGMGGAAYSISTNNGTSWSTPALMSETLPFGTPELLTDGKGKWMAVGDATYEGTGGTDSDIFYVTSTDDGATWSEPALVNNDAETDTNIDARPRVTEDGAGTWFVYWESKTAGVYAYSTDFGATWTDPVEMYGITRNLPYRPRAATNGAGVYVVALYHLNPTMAYPSYSDQDIFVTVSDGALYVNFDVFGPGTGTKADPFNTLEDALAVVSPGGDIKILSSSTASAMTLTVPCRLLAVGGSVLIGEVAP